MHRIFGTRAAVRVGVAVGASALALTAVPALAQTNTSTPTAHCMIGKLGLVVPLPDPQDPIAEFDTPVDLVGTTPDTAEVDAMFTISASVSFSITDADVAGALRSLGDSISTSTMDSNIGEAVRDEAGNDVGGGGDGLPGDPPTVTLTDDTLDFAGTLSGDQGGIPAPGSVTYGLGTFASELTVSDSAGNTDSVDLWCSLVNSQVEPLIGTVTIVAKGTTPGQPGGTPTTSPTSSAPAGTLSSPAPTTPTPKVRPKQALANTGAGNTVPLSLAGLALLMVGTGMAVVTRRRRSPAGSSDSA